MQKETKNINNVTNTKNRSMLDIGWLTSLNVGVLCMLIENTTPRKYVHHARYMYMCMKYNYRIALAGS